MLWTCVTIFWTFCEHVLKILWTCFEHFVNMLWTCCGHVLNMLWTRMKMWWKCDEHVMKMWLTCQGHVVNMWWKCHGHVLNMWWKCDEPGPLRMLFFWTASLGEKMDWTNWTLCVQKAKSPIETKSIYSLGNIHKNLLFTLVFNILYHSD